MSAVVFRLDGVPPRYAGVRGVTVDESDALQVHCDGNPAGRDMSFKRAAQPLFTVAMREQVGNVQVDVIDVAIQLPVGCLIMNVAGVIRFYEVVS